jgi:RNA polymerase sigma-70 factor (ECF subfamily)
MAGADREFTRALLETAPSLRAFAISLTGQIEKADDLVQDTLMRAWASADSFQQGSSLRAWLFTILRNSFTSQYRKRRREVEDVDGELASFMSSPPEQEGHVALDDLRTALAKLPDEQREAVLLVGASGFSYEEAAEITEVAIGTVKSRVNRARVRLAQLMYGDNWDGDLG